MTDWVSTAATAATAAGTLVLAVATFASVRSGQRAARATEAALLSSLRPVLAPSRLDDPKQKISFIDDHWLSVPGGRVAIDVVGDQVYLALSVRNVGNGIAVLDRWDLFPDRVTAERSAAETDGFRRLSRDIYVPAGDIGFWQGALRDPADPLLAPTRQAIAERRPMTLDLLYGDYQGGQRTISRFSLMPGPDGSWLAAVSRHWSLDRPNPR